MEVNSQLKWMAKNISIRQNRHRHFNLRNPLLRQHGRFSGKNAVFLPVFTAALARKRTLKCMTRIRRRRPNQQPSVCPSMHFESIALYVYAADSGKPSSGKLQRPWKSQLYWLLKYSRNQAGKSHHLPNAQNCILPNLPHYFRAPADST